MTPEQIPLLIGFIVMSLGSVAIFLHVLSSDLWAQGHQKRGFNKICSFYV